MKKTITPRVAYFSMEIALEPDVPTYSGGLGILAGDTLRSAADLGTPVVAVTLAYRKGYFRQILDSAGNQFEQPQEVLTADATSAATGHAELEAKWCVGKTSGLH